MEGSPAAAEGLETTLKLLRDHALDGNFDRIEDAWLHLVETSPQLESAQLDSHLDVFVGVGERFIGETRKHDRLGTLLELLLGALSERAPPRPLLRVYWLLVYCFPEKREHLAAFCDRYEDLYPLASAERALYEVCSLATTLDPAASLRRLETLLKFRAGAYVYHRSGWGVGMVEAVDPFLKQVKVDLEGKRGHRIAIDAVDSILEPLDPDGFLALRHRGGEELRRLRDDDPVRLMDLVIDAFGSPLSLKDVKARLMPEIVPADVWARWWNRTKGLLRGTGLYRVGDRPPHTVEKLATAVSYEDELLQRYLRCSWSEGRSIARQLSRKTGSAAWQRIRDHLRSLLTEGEPVVALEAALILEKAGGGNGGGKGGGKGGGNGGGGGTGAAQGVAGGVAQGVAGGGAAGDDAEDGRAGSDADAPRQILGPMAPDTVVAAIEALPSLDDQRRATESLPALRPEDWQDLAARLFEGKRDALADVALQVLERNAPERAAAIVEALVRSPQSAPDAFCLIASLHLGGADRPAVAPFKDKGPRGLLVLFLDLLEHLQHREARRGRLAVKGSVLKIQEVLTGDDAKVFRDGVRAMGARELREIHARIVRNDILAAHTRGDLLAVLAEYEPSLEGSSSMPIWEERAIYVTAEGLAKRKEELRVLMEEKLPKNFEDVGRAASFGDLSENAEYTGALEERDKLTKRATQMRSDVEIAKLIDPSRVEAGRVGLGSRIRLRNVRTGEEIAYSILGPWDGRPQEEGQAGWIAGGIVSYQSPLGRSFLGKSVGDVVQVSLPGGSETYEILESGSHFDAAL